MIFRKHSLLKRVTLWCAGTLAVFSLITAAASFAIGYEEAKDRQDDILKEVVGMLSRDIVQQRQRNKIQELTLGGFYGPGSDKGETLPQYGALTMDDDVFEDHFQLDDDSKDAVDGASRYDKIVSMIEESEKLKSGTENHALELADRLVPWCLAGTVVTYALTRNVTRAISILMVDFSCALKLSMPLAVLSAMRECGSYHITVKGGKYLEALSKADTIVFDKTGTLTHASPKVVKVVPFSGCDEEEVLKLAACLEEHFPHSMANAVVRAAKERGITHEEMHTEVEYIVAHGIASRVRGERVVIGSHHFVFEDEKCVIPAAEQQKFDDLEPEYSHLYLAACGQLVGVICIADPLRPEARHVLRQLRAIGVTNTVMMTGDSDRTAAAIARQVGVDQYFSEVLPEDKAEYVQKAKAEGHTVVMIGDGINDSPALSAADVGIAINSGAAIAREIADITIKADSLEELVQLKSIANAMQRRVASNYRFVLSFNSALIILGALGILQPATSAMLHNLSTIGISLKSMTNLLPEKTQSQLQPENTKA